MLKNESKAFMLSCNTLSSSQMTPKWFFAEKDKNKELGMLWREAGDLNLSNCELASSLKDANFLFAQALISDSPKISRSKELIEPSKTVYNSKKTSATAKDLLLALCYQIKYLGHLNYQFNSLASLVSFDQSCVKTKVHNTFPSSPLYAGRSSQESPFDRDTKLAIKRSRLDQGGCSTEEAWLKLLEEEKRTVAAFNEEEEIRRALEESKKMANDVLRESKEMAPPHLELPEVMVTEELASYSLELQGGPSTEEMGRLRVEYFKRLGNPSLELPEKP